MPTIAAIDVGSNAMRLVVGSVNGSRGLQLLESLREPVRLGQDVFTQGLIGEPTLERAIEAFVRFRKVIDAHNVQRVRAVATSAMREAFNRDIVIDRLTQASGIEVQVIDPEEEARLIHLAVNEALNLKNKLAMLVDIGGGSVEVTLAANGQIIATESFNMGTVRLLQKLEEKQRGQRQFNTLVREYVDATRRRLRKEIGQQKIDVCVGTGGNIETLGDLRQTLLNRQQNTLITDDELDAIIKQLQSLSYEERMRTLRLRPDRADVIMPAAIVLQKILKQAGVAEVMIPHVGLKDGLLLDIAQDVRNGRRNLHREQVLAAARRLGQKYAFDESHATTVANFAARLFDATESLHRLDEESRLLLEVAALLHDIGQFVHIVGHNKHSYYLLMATPLLGLTYAQRAIVANVARYHRKAFPTLKHEPYRNLSAKDRVVVCKLAALLRIADALDTEHAGKVHQFTLEYKKPKLIMRLHGEGDMLLEKWALQRKATLLEEVFGVKFVVED
ncbi:MAG: Ppx/GppA phosphatase family protein [Acidobacteriota bacterium]|nr:Ppx/GppA family phosphatase [Blastocatellia bacterium]MDW8238803.1 Ppx/GppA phosphatase family protein [Acidobacteriota bacterium]